MKLQVIYEDNHLIAINKRGGELSQKDYTNEPSLIEKTKDYLKEKYKKPGEVFLGSIHRLDQPTSGVLIFARTSKALSRMHDIFRKRLLTKKYHALVGERPPKLSDRLRDYLVKNQQKNKSFISKASTSGAKLAQLEYQLTHELHPYYLLDINLLTGRHHQIRAQLSARGIPIVGDLKYGYHTPNHDKSICLHCSSIEFIHPVKKSSILIKASFPKIKEWQGVTLSHT